MHEDETKKPLVVCLHGSAGNSGMWKAFRQAVRGRARVITPDLVGYGRRRFDRRDRHTLGAEVDAVLEQVGNTQEAFHVVAHSYGGAVATYLAKKHPERVASLVLYEPAIFPLLFAEGLHTPAAREIHALRQAVMGGAINPISRWRGARRFISYWASPRSWGRLSFAARCHLSRLTPKVVAEFDAMLAAQHEMSDVRDLKMPVRILCGTRTRHTVRRVAEIMAEQLDDVSLLRLVDMKHMAPVTHPQRVNPVILDYILPAPMAGQALAA